MFDALSGFCGRGKKRIYFREQRSNFEETGSEYNFWGIGNTSKHFLGRGGGGEKPNLFQGNRRTGTPWEVLIFLICYCAYWAFKAPQDQSLSI